MSSNDVRWTSDTTCHGQPCPACGAIGAREILVVGRAGFDVIDQPLHLLKCPNCRSLFYEGDNVVTGYNESSFEEFYWRHYLEVGAGIEAMIRPLAALGAKAKGDLLDVGCGFGYIPHFWEYVGRGKAIGLETAAYGKLGREKLGAQIYSSYCADCKEIAGRKFDIVYTSEVIEHVPDPSAFLAEIAEKLTPGGVLVLTTPSADFITPNRATSEMLAPLSPGYHYFLLSKEALRALIEGAGLKHCVVEDVAGRLMAWASRTPLPRIAVESFDWDEYLDYLRALAKNPDRSVASGALYRLFKDGLNTGRTDRAVTAFEDLSNIASARYDLDLRSIDVPKATAGKTLPEHLKTIPAWLGGALLFGGILNEVQGGQAERSVRMLGTAILVLQHEALIGAQFAGEAVAFLPHAQMQYARAQHRLHSGPAVERTERDLCLFAHYDAKGCIASHVLHYVKELQSAGFDVVFVSTADLGQAEQVKIAPYTIEVVTRPNTGYDFGSWIAAYARHKPTPNGLLLLCNDSVYGPLWNIGRALGKLFKTEADFYGMVMSSERGRHLQSWFLLFTPRAHQSLAFQDLMKTACERLTKHDVIEQLELKLTSKLEESGLTSHALYDPRQLRSTPKLAVNPSHYLWRQLVRTYGVPFIKVELLRDNPMRLPIAQWPNVVRRHNARAVEWITEHLPAGRAHPAAKGWAALYHRAVAHDHLSARLGLPPAQAMVTALYRTLLRLRGPYVLRRAASKLARVLHLRG